MSANSAKEFIGIYLFIYLFINAGAFQSPESLAAVSTLVSTEQSSIKTIAIFSGK